MTEPMTRIDNILDDGIGFVELWDQMGDDQRVAAAARVSLNRELSSLSDDSTKQQKRDAGLINRLMKDRHTSCFEHVVLTWRIRLPLFVVGQWQRHRLGSSFNEESGRYTELKDEVHIPSVWRKRVGKPMDYQFEALDELTSHELSAALEQQSRAGYELYQLALAKGVAHEQARFFLNVVQYKTFVWTVNVLTLCNFLHLRNSPHAQAEIRAYAKAIEGIFAERLPVTHAAYKAHWGDGIAMII